MHGEYSGVIFLLVFEALLTKRLALRRLQGGRLVAVKDDGRPVREARAENLGV